MSGDPSSLADRTVATWQPVSPDALDKTDANEIIQNTVGFYGTLLMWVSEGEPKIRAFNGQ